MGARPCEQLHGVGDAGQIGADVEGISNKKTSSGNREKRTWKLAAKRRGQSASSHHADSSAHRLHRGHQRPGHERRPKQGIAKLCAGYGIGRDTGRVVVGRSSDDPGAEGLPEFAEFLPTRNSYTEREAGVDRTGLRRASAVPLGRDYSPRRLIITRCSAASSVPMERQESDPPPAATSSARAETWVWTLDPAAFGETIERIDIVTL